MEGLDISEQLDLHIKTALENLVDDNGIPDNYGGCVDTSVEEICHTAYDGFIPFTNGGYALTLPTDLRSAWGSGDYPSDPKALKIIEDAIDYSLKGALKDFIVENKDKLKELFPNVEPEDMDDSVVNYHILYEMDQGTLAEELSECEDSWMTEGSTFFYQFRVIYYTGENSHGDLDVDNVCFISGTNTDFEYGRDKGLEFAYEKTVALKDLTPEMVDVIIKDMVDSI